MQLKVNAPRGWLERLKTFRLNRWIGRRKSDRYIFTDHRHSWKGVLSFLLGAISIGALCAAVVLSCVRGGEAPAQYALTAVLALVFSLAGLWLGMAARRERDVYRIFPNLGLTVNLLTVAGLAGVLYLGVR